MTTMNWRNVLVFRTGVTLIVTGLLIAFAGPGAHALSGRPVPSGQSSHTSAVNGDNGTVKIHRSTTAVSDPRNEPHVCVFYLDAFGFDPAQAVSWRIESWPPTGDRSVVSSGVLTLDSMGGGSTSDMTLPNGHYKLFWNFTGENGFAKQKVFWVACPAPSPSGSPLRELDARADATGTPTPSPNVPPTSSTTASASSTVSPVATISPVAAPSPPSQGGLPITGWPLALIALAGAALLGTGSAAIVVARRRRGLHSR